MARRALHLELARRRGLDRRFLRGGGLSLAASLAAWGLGAPSFFHLLAVALGFCLGALWRPQRTARRAEGWALGWIETQAGLSYQTALELPTATVPATTVATPSTPPTTGNAADGGFSASDPYGLGRAVRQRAETATRRLAPPPSQPWWLPLLVLALLFALLPALNLPGFRTPLNNLGGTPPGIGAPQTGAPSDEEQGQDATAEDPAPTTRAEDSTDAEQAESSAEDSPVSELSPEAPAPDDAPAPADGVPGESAETSGLGEQGEQGALERYLSELEGAQPPEATTDDTTQDTADAAGGGVSGPPPGFIPPNPPQSDSSPGGATGPQADAETRAQADSDQPSGDGQGSPQDAPPEEAQEGTGEGSAPTDPAASADAGADAAEASPAPSDEGEGSDETEGGSQSAAPTEGQEDTGEQAAALGEGEGETEPSEEEGAPGSGENDATPENGGGESGSGNEADSATSSQAEEGQGGAAQAGTRGDGTEEGVSERLSESPDAPLQRLSGVRDESGPSQRGEVLQRGSDDVTLPQGGSPESYTRAAEEAISEGRLPLEYQDIVREYFR